jgi:hypothetical protein
VQEVLGVLGGITLVLAFAVFIGGAVISAPNLKFFSKEDEK